MKAFRNTGIEGGAGSIATQNWLLHIHRKTNPRGVYRTTKDKYVPVKTIEGKQYRLSQRDVAAIIAYSQNYGSEFVHSWDQSNKLAALGYLEMIQPPERFTRKSRTPVCRWEAFGARFKITDKGLKLIAELTARGESK